MGAMGGKRLIADIDGLRYLDCKDSPALDCRVWG